MADAIKQDVLGSAIRGVSIGIVFDRPSGQVKIDIRARQIPGVKAAKTIFHGRPAAGIVIFPGKMGIIYELRIVVIVIIHFAWDDLGGAGFAMIYQRDSRFLQHDSLGIATQALPHSVMLPGRPER